MRGDMAILHHPRGPVARLVDALPAVLRQNARGEWAINLQYGRCTRTAEEPPSLGHVPVVATQDGPVIRFDEYAEIFDIAVKVAKGLTCGVKRR
jgi:hypothetical protein